MNSRKPKRSRAAVSRRGMSWREVAVLNYAHFFTAMAQRHKLTAAGKNGAGTERHTQT